MSTRATVGGNVPVSTTPAAAPSRSSSVSAAARAKDLARFIKVKTVVGNEVQPAFGDALSLRKEVFCGEQGVTLAEEVDGLDAVSVHLIAYVDSSARERFQKEQEVLARLTASSGVAVKYKHPSPATVASLKGERPARYRPPRMEPIGTLRLRRVSACSQLGKFNMMIGKIERLCVRKAYRRSGAGEMLLQAAERAAKSALHVPLVMMHAQVHAKAFYLRCGYMVWSEKEFMDANIPHLVMVKNLTETKLNCEQASQGHAGGCGEAKAMKPSAQAERPFGAASKL